jgi:hypothetical protein
MNPGSPPPGSHPPGTIPVNPQADVQLPATLLIVTAGVGALLQVLSLILNLTGAGVASALGDYGGAMMGGASAVFFSLIGLAMAGFLAFAALQMKQLQSWGIAFAGSIIAMIPCISPCCLMGLPIGIWAVIVLLKPEVKGAFRS